MFYCSLEAIKHDLEYQQSIRDRYTTMLRRYDDYADWTLRMRSSHGTDYYYARRRKGNQDEELSLGTRQNPHVQNLQKRYFLIHAIRRATINIRLLQTVLSKYQSIDPNVMREQFPASQQFLDDEIFRTAGIIDVKQWQAMKKEKELFYEEGLQQVLVDGTRVRSKSEVVIGNALLAAGIPFKYEERHRFGKQIVHADFTVYSSSSAQEIIWEHFGRMFDEEYRRQYAAKLGLYSDYGYLPGVNLITTFDDQDGNLNTQKIGEIINYWFK